MNTDCVLIIRVENLYGHVVFEKSDLAYSAELIDLAPIIAGNLTPKRGTSIRVLANTFLQMGRVLRDYFQPPF